MRMPMDAKPAKIALASPIIIRQAPEIVPKTGMYPTLFNMGGSANSDKSFAEIFANDDIKPDISKSLVLINFSKS